MRRLDLRRHCRAQRWFPRGCAACVALLAAHAAPASAELPSGYLVWTKGEEKAPQTRKIYRMTLPGKSGIVALTSGEDVQGQISPDGRWVAYAKAKAPGSDYHNFALWRVHVVSIHGVTQGHAEVLVGDGYWPSWGADGSLYYNEVDGKHSQIVRVALDERGAIKDRATFFSTRSGFGEIDEIGECFVAPDASWFAARTRGVASVRGVGAYQIEPPTYFPLAKAGSVGCMPIVAPSSTWALIAGAAHGIRWGDAPSTAERKQDELLIPTPSPAHKAYHPGISSDESWAMVAFGTDDDHNSGVYDIYIYRLDATAKTVSDEQLLVAGGFNGWPHIWVGKLSGIDAFRPSSYTLVAGEPVTLYWQTTGADVVELDGEAVAPSGEKQLVPTRTTVYELVARNSFSGEEARQSVEVTVHATPQPVIIEAFEAKPAAIAAGESTTLTWRVVNPTTLDLDGQPVPPKGTLKLSPPATVELVLTARGHEGPVQRSVKITVADARRLERLPDRGGFLCALEGGERALPGVLLLAVAPLLLWRRARQRRRL